MHDKLAGIGITKLLDADPRPSFVVELAACSRSVIYTNAALNAAGGLAHVARTIGTQHAEFADWIAGTAQPHNASTCFAEYNDTVWTRLPLQQDLVAVSANQQSLATRGLSMKTFPPIKRSESSSEPHGTPKASAVNGSTLSAGGRLQSLSSQRLSTLRKQQDFSPTSEPGSVQELETSQKDPGWRLFEMVAEERPFLEVITNVDWESTGLGAMSAWPKPLERTFGQILADSRPIAIYWGPSYMTLYNEAFSKLCGSKHPYLLGKPVEEIWPTECNKLRDLMKWKVEHPRSDADGEWRCFIEKSDRDDEPNRVEESYLKWSLIPIMESNQCLGFLHTILETTSMRLWERRMQMLIKLGEALVTARSVQSYWEKTIEELEAMDPSYDIPLAVLYSVVGEAQPAGKSVAGHGSRAKCRLAGSLGAPKGHPIAPGQLDLETDEGPLADMFRKAIDQDAETKRQPILVQTKDGTLPESLLEGLDWRGFKVPCRAAVICPIRPTKEENVMGLLLLGLNPRRLFDNEYLQYILLLNQKLTSSLASTVLIEEEARRGRNAAEQAAYDQAMLQEKLTLQTTKATELSRMFETVAHFIPVGMCFGDALGNITFANDAWYNITGQPKDARQIDTKAFLSCVREQDRQTVANVYKDLKTTKRVTFEFRVTSQTPLAILSPSFEKISLDLMSTNNLKERDVLATAAAERAGDGSIIRILTCLTDVTLHKRTAEEASYRAQQAENLKRLAEFATVGMYDMDLDGRLLGANHVFFDMCGISRVDPKEMEVRPWDSSLLEDYKDAFRESLDRMVRENKTQSLEVRLKTIWMAQDASGQHKTPEPRWVQATLMPVRDAKGKIQSVMGCLNDISLQKWQLDKEKQRKEEAIESKRQQENFIDMTSHEMRNPLSAIVHCADSIIASMTRLEDLLKVDSEADASAGSAGSAADSESLVRTCNADSAASDATNNRREAQSLVQNSVDNAETIVACAQHQKRIVDDILTMSKLDSKLLAVTAITVDPLQTAQEAIKMFEVEARRVDIKLNLVVNDSYRNLRIKFLDFDPSRLKQVLINLLTNALKFTKTGPMRNVTVRLSASTTRPTDETSSVQFIPRCASPNEGIFEPVPCDVRGDAVFLLFEVKDTGQGLTDEEKSSLFQRFVQASNRTHVKYGGSGLGLFISRRLTELQNGAIGVASQPGVGSTFAFYIEGHRPSEAAHREAEAAAKVAQLALHVNTRLSQETSESSTLILAKALGHCSSTPKVAPEIRGVLVVEDNLINQHITRRHLIGMGLSVEVANHGVECLEKLPFTDRWGDDAFSAPGPQSPEAATRRAARPAELLKRSLSRLSAGSDGISNSRFPLSIILMDIEMPKMDGLTCTRHIRNLEKHGNITGGRIPIIAVSANARLEQITEAKAAGCDDVLVKPYRMPELIEKMRMVAGLVHGDESSPSGVQFGPGNGKGRGEETKSSSSSRSSIRLGKVPE